MLNPWSSHEPIPLQKMQKSYGISSQVPVKSMRIGWHWKPMWRMGRRAGRCWPQTKLIWNHPTLPLPIGKTGTNISVKYLRNWIYIYIYLILENHGSSCSNPQVFGAARVRFWTKLDHALPVPSYEHAYSLCTRWRQTVQEFPTNYIVVGCKMLIYV